MGFFKSIFYPMIYSLTLYVGNVKKLTPLTPTFLRPSGADPGIFKVGGVTQF